MTKRLLFVFIPIALILLAVCVARADYSTRDAVLVARACVHEATWAGGIDGTNDCGGIIQVVESRREERESFASALARTMPRFNRRSTDRAWVHAFGLRPVRRDPPGWPSLVPASNFSERWQSVLARVQGLLGEREPLPCVEQPSRWFGRRTDHERLEAVLATGEWREADCGPTRNAFLYAVDVE